MHYTEYYSKHVGSEEVHGYGMIRRDALGSRVASGEVKVYKVKNTIKLENGQIKVVESTAYAMNDTAMNEAIQKWNYESEKYMSGKYHYELVP